MQLAGQAGEGWSWESQAPGTSGQWKCTSEVCYEVRTPLINLTLGPHHLHHRWH